MDIQSQRILSKIAGPLVPEKLSTVAETLMSPYKFHFQKVVEQIVAQNPKVIKGIDFGFVDDTTINALAYADGRYEIIGINAGVAFLIPLISNWLLSHPNIFPDIGNPEREASPKPFEASLLTEPHRLQTIDQMRIPLVAPVDPIRAHYAAYMSMVAWDFLLHHELAHINRCHLHYLSQRLGLSSQMTTWHEFHREKIQKRAALQRVLEIDADSVAARITAGAPRLNGLDKMKLFAFGDAGRDERLWNWQRVYQIWIRCIGFLFHLMAMMDNVHNVDEPLRSHPHPDIRVQVLLNFIWPQWNTLIPNRDDIVEINRKTGAEMHEIFLEGILPMPASRVDPSYSEGFVRTVHEMWDSVHSIAQELNTLTEDRWVKVATR